LFLSLIRHYSENGYFIRYFKYDSPLSSEASEMEQLKLSWKTCIIDGNEDMVSVENSWISEIKNGNVLIAIDSLSPLLLNWTVGEVASALKNLQKTSEMFFK
jgi:elongator complex protein 5